MGRSWIGAGNPARPAEYPRNCWGWVEQELRGVASSMLERMVHGDAAAIASRDLVPARPASRGAWSNASMGWSPRSAGRGRTVLGDQPLVGKAVVIAETQDHVVHERHAEKLPGGDQTFGEPAIFRTGRAVA